MKLKDMTEMDVTGILFSEFPDDMSLTESRDYLEMLIAEIYEEDCIGLNEDEYPEIVISPFMVMRALMRRAIREFKKMTDAEKERVRQEFWESRKKRINGIDKPTSQMV